MQQQICWIHSDKSPDETVLTTGVIPCCAVAFDLHRGLHECVRPTLSDALCNTLILFNVIFRKPPAYTYYIKSILEARTPTDWAQMGRPTARERSEVCGL